MSEDKPKFFFEEDNTEGDHPVSFRINNAEIKKGERIVATELNDLYDVDIETDPPNEADALIYDSSRELWVPGSISGGCSLISGTLRMFVFIKREDFIVSYRRYYDYSNPDGNHPIYGTNDPSEPIGSFSNPFTSIDKAFDWLQENCYTISNDAKVEMIVISDGPLELWVSWESGEEVSSIWLDWTPVIINYAYANRVFIYGADFDGLSTFNPSVSLDVWETVLNPLNIQYRMNADFEITESGDTWGGGDSDCDLIYKNILDALKPFISVPKEKSLGGLYNFRFLDADFQINCSSGGGSSF